MKKVFVAAAFAGLFFAVQLQAQCTPGERATINTMIDLGKAKVSVKGKSYRYVLGTKQALQAPMNGPGKVSLIDAEGYLMRVGDGETVFVITKIEVTGVQG